MLRLNGLNIARIDDDAAAVGDVAWCTRRVGALPAEPNAGEPIAIVRRGDDGPDASTDHIFGYDGRVRCRFRVNADGTRVECDAIAEVSARDIFSLFAEPIMRTILVRRGLLSFHAAALAKAGQAILIMADKGTGKSTLSWALQTRGWRLLADDLARVDQVAGQWSVYRGHRQTKLTPGAMRAFGNIPHDMLPRFDDAGSPAYAAQFDKRVIDAADAIPEPDVAVPLAALCFLTPRDPASDAVRHVELSMPTAARHLIEHSTPDPLDGRVSGTPALQRAIGALATQVQAFALTLPDRFDRLDQATSVLASIASGSDQCA